MNSVHFTSPRLIFVVTIPIVSTTSVHNCIYNINAMHGIYETLLRTKEKKMQM